MKDAKKLEIITEKRATEQILEIIDNYGVTGYTIIDNITGKGKRGLKHGEDLNDVFKNTLIITICDETQMYSIVQELKVIFKRISGICVVSDVKYVIH